jgi:uncharacterized protein (UPF0332 family)
MSPPQLAWLEKSRRFLRSGYVLLELDDPDSAAGRAYYAMFHAAEAPCCRGGWSTRLTGPCNQLTGVNLQKSGLLPERFHRALLDAYESRLSADYESGAGIDPETVRKHMAAAEEFVDAAATFLGQAGSVSINRAWSTAPGGCHHSGRLVRWISWVPTQPGSSVLRNVQVA